MTEAELDETKAMPPSRIIRIAKGSGHYPHQVAELLEQFKLMQTTMQKTMKKNKKMGKGGMCAAPPPPPHRPAATRLSTATRRPAALTALAARLPAPPLRLPRRVGCFVPRRDLHNMDAATVAQMMHKMNPQMLAHLGGQAGLEQMMSEMEKEEKKLKKK